MLLVQVFGYLHVEVGAKVLGVLMALEWGTIIILSVVIFAKGGAGEGFAAGDVFSPSAVLVRRARRRAGDGVRVDVRVRVDRASTARRSATPSGPSRGPRSPRSVRSRSSSRSTPGRWSSATARARRSTGRARPWRAATRPLTCSTPAAPYLGALGPARDDGLRDHLDVRLQPGLPQRHRPLPVDPRP